MISPVRHGTAPVPTPEPAVQPVARTRSGPPPPAVAPPAAPATTSTADGAVRRLLVDLDGQRLQLDRMIEQAARGRSFSPGELMALQARVYAYGESLEVVSHVVDRTVSTVKTLLNTQL